ncbi:MAG: ferrochelatase [Sandaracinaceae bacterium]
MASYDALLVLSFGGPRGPDEVMPFLEAVTHGRGVPRERLLAVAEHYFHMGGVSPINARTDDLIEALRRDFAADGRTLPIYLGNRFWDPKLDDTVRRMAQDGVRRAIAFKTSAYSSWSGCRAYRTDLERALGALGDDAFEVDVIRPFYDHPDYVATCVERLEEALGELARLGRERQDAHVVYTAHSIPRAQAAQCDYEAQLATLVELVSERAGVANRQLVYQSRSGPPQVPWLEPDILDALDALADRAPGASVIVAPFGFVADHMEVVWDLDHEAKERAEALGLTMVRAKSANDHPRLVRMVGQLIDERLDGSRPRLSLAPNGPRPDECAPDCCPPARRA